MELKLLPLLALTVLLTSPVNSQDYAKELSIARVCINQLTVSLTSNLEDLKSNSVDREAVYKVYQGAILICYDHLYKLKHKSEVSEAIEERIKFLYEKLSDFIGMQTDDKFYQTLEHKICEFIKDGSIKNSESKDLTISEKIALEKENKFVENFKDFKKVHERKIDGQDYTDGDKKELKKLLELRRQTHKEYLDLFKSYTNSVYVPFSLITVKNNEKDTKGKGKKQRKATK